MKILATDLDRTLLPNGSWKADSEAISLFNDLTEKQGVLVVYVTGRNLALTETAIKEFGVRYPDVLCGDVVTSIRKYENGQWKLDEGWISLVRRASPRWDADAIRDAVADIDGMREQESEHLNQFKQSYYVAHDKTYFPRILIRTFHDFPPSRNLIAQALLFSGGHAKSSQLRVAPLKGDNS